MAIIDYASLQSALGDWLNRQDLATVLPTFISLAEGDFNRGLRTREMLARSDTTATAELTALPSDFLEMYSLEQTYPPASAYPAQPPMRYVGVEEMKQIKAQLPTNVTRWYTIMGNYIDLWPTPNDGLGNTSIKLTMNYYAAIPALSNVNTTNWLLTKSPNIYLYGALRHTAPYLKNDERVQVWDAAYQQIVAALAQESERSMRPTTGLLAKKRNFGI